MSEQAGADRQRTGAAKAQSEHYHQGVDYVAGSPHLKHDRLRSRIDERIRRLVAAPIARSGRCRVLEVGGGHGTFTELLAGIGADVTVTEVSRASADALSARFHDSSTVTVVYDPDAGDATFEQAADFDLVLCVSVLHHIPDYLSFVARSTALLRAGGTFATYQDPDSYPRRRSRDTLADRAAYFAWRVTRGNLIAGAKTRLRRLRGRYDESLPADMTEYHVVRQGVDDLALVELLRRDFAEVDRFVYWSTQAGPLQRWGDRLGFKNTFGIEATGKLREGGP